MKAPGRHQVYGPLILLGMGLVTATLDAAAPANVFRAGAATANITPPLNVLLDGTIMKIGPAKHVHDELHVRCLAFDDGRTRLAIAIVDNTMMDRSIHDEAKRLVREAIQLPAANILIAATHTHSTPRAVDIGQGAANEAYHRFLARRVADGIRRAFNHLAPAEIAWGRAFVPQHVHNRRWFVTPELIPPNPFGRKGDRVWMNPPRGDALIRPAGPVDADLFVVSLRDLKARPFALLGNYGLHYVGGIPGGTISADYFGMFAQKVFEQVKGVDFDHPPFVGLMSNGTSGDVNANDFRNPRKPFPPYGHARHVAEDLAREARQIYNEIDGKHRRDMRLGVAYREIELGVRKPDAARLEWARETMKRVKPGARLTRPQVYAEEALGLAAYPDRVSVPLQAFRLGDLAICAIPNEVFAETGLALKSRSPFKDTFTIELANGYHGYLPTAKQHEWGGYETWPARSSFLEVDAETKIRATMLELLNQLHTDK